ncbi:MAG TPA: hypothetical protein VFP72_15260 [Kineosporiaceae bacterium]|nr:hypothetical protein [Kineosporiaceae bacterium]
MGDIEDMERDAAVWKDRASQAQEGFDAKDLGASIEDLMGDIEDKAKDAALWEGKTSQAQKDFDASKLDASKLGAIAEFSSKMASTKEGAQMRRLIVRVFVAIFAIIVLCSAAGPIYGTWLPARDGDVLVDRILKVNQTVIPIISLAIGFYFGTGSGSR